MINNPLTILSATLTILLEKPVTLIGNAFCRNQTGISVKQVSPCSFDEDYLRA